LGVVHDAGERVTWYLASRIALVADFLTTVLRDRNSPR